MRAGFGCLLIIAATILLVAIIVVPVLPFTATTDSIDTLLSRVLCQPREQVVREQYTTTDFDGTGFSMNVYCETAGGQQRDVTGSWAIIGGAAFLVPFLIGLVLFIVGVRGRRPVPSEVYNMAGVPTSVPAVTVRTYNPQSAPPSSTYDLSDIAPTMTIRPSQVQAAQQAQTREVESLQPTQPIQSQPTQPIGTAPHDPNSLTARLKQIEDARNSGLITAQEYERLRQEIIGNIS